MKKILLVTTVLLLTLSWTFASRNVGPERVVSAPVNVVSETHSHQEQSPADTTQIELLDYGDYYTDQAPVRQSGEKWLGLDVKSSTLHSCTIEVKPGNEEEGVQVMQHISVEPPVEPLFLLRGGGLTSGPVVTVFSGNWEQSLTEKSPLTFRLADVSYELKIIRSEDTATCEEEGLPLNARLLLTSGESRQVLYSLVDCGPDAAWHLLWAGDLDRDGKLDLFVSVGQGMYDSPRKLFLSSKAGKGRLVKEVAELISHGC